MSTQNPDPTAPDSVSAAENTTLQSEAGTAPRHTSRKGILRRILRRSPRLWLAATAVILGTSGYVAYRMIPTRQAVEQPSKPSWLYDPASSMILFSDGTRREINSLAPLAAALSRLNPSQLHLAGGIGITGLEHVSADKLAHSLKGCINLASLHDIPQNVEKLTLDGCGELTSLKHLPAGVQTFILFECHGLTSLEHLPAGVKGLRLEGCTGLTSLEHLPAGVQKFSFTGCTGLTSLEHLPADVQELRLGGCTRLTSIEHLPETLRYLDVEGCKNLRHLGPLPAGLQYVDITDCFALRGETLGRLREWAKGGKKGERTFKDYLR